MGGNQTVVTEFILLGFCLGPRIQILLFGLFCLSYTFTLLENRAILGLISLDSRIPAKPISFAGCMKQTFLFLTFTYAECLLLAVLSYEQYVALCHPLQYSVIVSWSICITLVVISWAGGSLLALVHVGLVLRLLFCGLHEINHFF
uniref:G-protein coupled receptors family 1 profile domain-containing protein n=1 Tax=Monodon monoceros TaxID=40151 RepID=A0A8C6BK30_MONMO